MNKVMLVGRLTRDPELRSLPSGKHVATFTIATNEFRGGGGERTEYHPCVAWAAAAVLLVSPDRIRMRATVTKSLVSSQA